MNSSDRSISNSERRSRTLGLIADTLFPATGDPLGVQQSLEPTEAKGLNLVSIYRSLIQTSESVTPEVQWDSLLENLENASSNQADFGIDLPFSSMSREQRTVVLQKWRDHEVEPRRLAFQALKRSGLYAAYSHLDDGGKNPNWRTLDYQPVANVPPATDPSDIQIADLKSIEREYDVVVIGSGAGGSVAACELTRAGSRVLVLEQGIAPTPSQLGQSESYGNRKLMAKSLGPMTPEGMPILLSGRGLGGGTTVNWMSCLPPSTSVLESWGDGLGLPFVSQGDLAEHCNNVMRALGAAPQPHLMNRQNLLLKQGCDALGWQSLDIPRNTAQCEACDLCQFGCSAGHKLDARMTFLREASHGGATLLTRTRVIKVEERGRQQTTLKCVHQAEGGEKVEFKIQTSKVIIAAGSVETPALLHRSGIRNPHLGQHLHLHPTAIVFGRYETPVHPWQGPPQSVVCEEFADDLLNDGFRLETVPLHPGLAAMAFAWDTARQHRTRMLQLNHIAGWLVLLQDLDGGHISLDQARSQPHYRLSERDEFRLKRGITRAMECHRAAGASEVFISTHRPHPIDLREPYRDTCVHPTIASMESSGLGLYSAHQMSTCRIAATPDHGVTNIDGKVFGTDHLYVADASLCPTATGVNPMITVMGLARHVSQRLTEDRS